MITLVIMSTLVVLFSSCGVKHTSFSPSVADGQSTSQSCQGRPIGANLQKVDVLYQNTSNFIEDYHLTYAYPSLKNIGASYPDVISLSAWTPLEVSEAKIARYYQSIVAEIEKMSDSSLNKYLLEGARADFSAHEVRMSYGERYKISRVVSEIVGLKAMALRWTNAQCHAQPFQENISKDVADFIVLRSFECPFGGIYIDPEGEDHSDGDNFETRQKLCLRNVLASWDESLYDSLRPMLRARIIGLCQTLRNEKCQENFENAYRGNSLLDFYNKLSSRVEEQKYLPFFNLKPRDTKYKCEKTNNGLPILMKLPFYVEDAALKPLVTQALKRLWTNPGIFEPIPEFLNASTSKSISVVWTEESISHVNESEIRVIKIARNLMGNKEAIRTTIGHELGHVMGFSDCYVEYLSADRSNLTYYEIDSNNLMCSLNARNGISLDYLNQVRHSRCDFN